MTSFPVEHSLTEQRKFVWFEMARIALDNHGDFERAIKTADEIVAAFDKLLQTATNRA